MQFADTRTSVEDGAVLYFSELPESALPIGISCYTFQALSYIIDVCRGDVKAHKSWVNFAMYISLFFIDFAFLP